MNDTIITLYSGVPLDPNYNHVIDFPASTVTISKAIRDAWLNNFSPKEVMDDLMQVKPQPFKLEIDLEEANKYNYMTYQNSNGKVYYCFIDRVEFISELVTLFYPSIDTYQTYLYDFNFHASFINREHQDRVENVGGIYKLKLDNTKSEPISYGNDYVLSSTQKVENSRYTFREFQNNVWFMIISTNPIGVDQEPAQFAQMGYAYYVTFFPKVPHYHREQNTTIHALKSISIYNDVLAKNVDIVAIVAMPTLPFEYGISKHPTYLDTPMIETSLKFRTREFGDGRVLTVENNMYPEYPLNDYLYFNFPEKTVSAFNRLSLRSMAREGKLLTHPYSFKVLTDNQSEPLILKNEYLQHENDRIKLKYYQSLGPSGKYKLGLINYNSDANDKEVMIVNNKIRELPLSTDAWLVYEKQQRASQIAGISSGLAGAGIGALGLLLSPATAGASLAVGLAGASLGVASKVAQFNAKEREIKSLPDTIRSNGNDLVFDLVSDNVLPIVYDKTITPEFKQTVYDYLYYFGYNCSEIKVPNLQSRYYFNYIQTTGVKLSPKSAASIPNDALKELKRIYDTGTTIYHVRASSQSDIIYLGDTYENAEMSLL